MKARRWNWLGPLGYGPDLLTDIEGRGPLVRAEDVVAIGYRDHKDQEEAGSQPLPAELEAFDLPAIRKGDIETVTPRGC